MRKMNRLAASFPLAIAAQPDKFPVQRDGSNSAVGHGRESEMGIYLTKAAPSAFADVSVEQTYHVKFKPASRAEMKALGDNLPDGYIAGWASTKDMDLYRHKVMPNAFAESIVKNGLTGPKGIKLLLNHDWRNVAGIIKVLEYRNGDLWIEAQLNLEIGYAKDAWLAAKMVGGLSFSVGFMLQKYAIEGSEDEGGEWLRIDKGDLYEVSVVPFPGNPEATMEFVKNREQGVYTSITEFEKGLIALGVVKSRNDAKRVTQAVKASAALFHKGAVADPVVSPPPFNDPPRLAVEKVQKLADLTAQMKAIMAQ
jgi:HK97 family phage prohead protease